MLFVLLSSGAVAATAQTPPSSSPSPAAAPSPTSAQDIGDIVVTAQRRSERLRDVPISITALTQDRLIQSGINNMVDIQRVTPGVQLPFYGGFLQPAIRGISSAGAGLGDSSNVAVYVDGIYQPSQSGQLLDLPDVQSVEILKGPQGTLYGQNAAGGAITINTVTPRFDLAGRMSASYGNYDDIALRGYITGPIVDEKIAVSIAGAYENRDGYNHDILRGGRDRGLTSHLIRGRILFKPTETLSLIVGAYSSKRSDGGIYAGQPVGPGTALGYALADAYGIPIALTMRPHQFALNVLPITEIKTSGVNLIGKLELDLGTINSTTALSRVHVHDVADVDYTAANLGIVNDLTLKNRNFIQELNFTSRKLGRMTVSAGLFYLALTERGVPGDFTGYFAGGPLFVYPNFGTPTLYIHQFSRNRKRSYAAYAEVGYDITDSLSLTVGGRYSYETQKTADNHSVLFGPDVGNVLLPDPRGKIAFKRFTPRATLRYALNPSSNVYASYSQGFKSGYVNSGDAPFPPYVKPVQPEKVYAYEVGYKGRLATGLNLNIAAFYYDYKDLQVYTYSPPVEFYRNAASARIKGIDGDLTWEAVQGLTFTVGAAYLDAHYTKFLNAVAYLPNAGGFGFDVTAIDASGNRLPRAPKLSGNASVRFQKSTEIGQFGAYVGGNYNSGISYDAANTVRQGRYALLDAELSFSPSAIKGLRLVAWGKNLTNRNYLSSVLESQFVLGGSYGDPRTYGVRAEFAF
ncbi:TonB-dependent receptor [Sphingomonas sp. BIUV-7]|uniref:TonB-dependent receptor n=1 Tax=Sphingomonas natans TaxID=3063330 RepID=A0ABT8Y8A1_9SPHN|nr:TonB-dependent receptor [Sphingomonas sp. BIUV-7]MDO6414550.1 TonB-dependent receptor [Sphingomonas sp. BIUV-7]